MPLSWTDAMAQLLSPSPVWSPSTFSPGSQIWPYPSSAPNAQWLLRAAWSGVWSLVTGLSLLFNLTSCICVLGVLKHAMVCLASEVVFTLLPLLRTSLSVLFTWMTLPFKTQFASSRNLSSFPGVAWSPLGPSSSWLLSELWKNSGCMSKARALLQTY